MPARTKKIPLWLKALIGLSLAIFALLIGAYFALSRDEPPPDVSDLQIIERDIPDDQNAYALLTKLAGDVPDPFNELNDQADQKLEAIENGQGWDAEFVAHLLENTEHLWPALDHALAAPHSQAPQLNSYADLVPEAGAFRRLARLAQIRATQLAYAGSPEAGITLLTTVANFGQTLQNSQGTLIIWLSGCGIKLIALDGIVLIAENFDVSATETISALRFLHSTPASLQDGFRGEHRILSNTLIDLKSGQASELLTLTDENDSTSLRMVARLPMALKANKTQRLHAEHLRRIFELIDTDTKTVQAAGISKKFFKSAKRSFLPNNLMGRIFLAIITPTYDTLLATRHHEQSRLSATQAFLAVRAYQKNHDGELPPTLDALVPDYLPAVPLDYYDRQPIRYSREFLAIWSLGRAGEYTVTSADQTAGNREIHLRLP